MMAVKGCVICRFCGKKIARKKNRAIHKVCERMEKIGRFGEPSVKTIQDYINEHFTGVKWENFKTKLKAPILTGLLINSVTWTGAPRKG